EHRRPKDNRPPPSGQEDRQDQSTQRRPRFSSSADPQTRPDAGSPPQSDDSERGGGRAQQLDIRVPESEAPSQQRTRRFSPAPDPQMPPEDRSGRPAVDAQHERGQARGPPRP